MKLRDLLEAPLADISIHGDPEPKSFTKKELELIKNLTAEKVYHKKLAKLPFNFYIYVLNADDLKELGETFPESTLDLDELGKLGSHSIRALTKSEHVPLFAKVADNRKKDPDGVHLVMGDNYSETNQIAPTPWMFVHRLLHAVDAEELTESFEELVDNLKDQLQVAQNDVFDLMSHAMTFKSAKFGHEGELLVDLMTQTLITGSVKFDEAALEKELSNWDPKINNQAGFIRILKAFWKKLDDYVHKRLVPEMKGQVYYI